MGLRGINRKSLNNKGFTLIELLAVVVILAIVMGISASSVLTSINNSRKSSLYSAAQTAANQLNQWITEDAVVSSANEKMLGDDFVKATQGRPDEWICLNQGDVEVINNRSGSSNANLLKALGINSNDIVTGETVDIDNDTKAAKDTSCSALRYNHESSAYEVLLIAKSGGKYYVTTDSSHYAFSSASNANTPLK